MFITIESNELYILDFLRTSLKKMSYEMIPNNKNYRALNITIEDNKYEIKVIESTNNLTIISKPFHYSSLINAIIDFKNSYFENIGPLKFYPSTGAIALNDQTAWLSEKQNKILSRLVCFKKGIERKNLYLSIWPRDKDISENKLDTHLTNLKNLIFNFSDYSLKFSSLKGIIKLRI